MRLIAYADSRIEGKELKELAPCTFFNVAERVMYMMWATDLLPHEIDKIKTSLPEKIAQRQHSKDAVFVGTLWQGRFGNDQEIGQFKKACLEANLSFVHRKRLSMEDNIYLVQNSHMAPSIQGKWQCENGYVPCRIFKNISYGHFGITNNPTVQRLFNDKLVYHSDAYQLFFEAQRKLATATTPELCELMNFVRDHHTYITRVEQLITVFSMIYQAHTSTA